MDGEDVGPCAATGAAVVPAPEAAAGLPAEGAALASAGYGRFPRPEPVAGAGVEVGSSGCG